MYLEAKYHFKKDLKTMIVARKRMNILIKAGLFDASMFELFKISNGNTNLATEKRLSLYYFFEDSVNRRLTEECIWSRDGCYTWSQAYDRVNQYAQWYLSKGIKPGDIMAFFLQNSPDFILAWIGLWAIGAAPAMINYNLSGSALIHCVKTSGAKMILVDKMPELRSRVQEVRETLEGEYGMNIVVLDAPTLLEICALEPKRPEDRYREVVQRDWPMALFYTRSVVLNVH